MAFGVVSLLVCLLVMSLMISLFIYPVSLGVVHFLGLHLLSSTPDLALFGTGIIKVPSLAPPFLICDRYVCSFVCLCFQYVCEINVECMWIYVYLVILSF